MSARPSSPAGRTDRPPRDAGGDHAFHARRRTSRFVGEDGFTLLEVLVAFTVMAILLSVLFRGVVTMRAGSNAFDDRTHVELVAEAVLEDALADRTLRTGTSSGIRDGRHWTLVARPIDLTAQLPRPPEDPASNPPPQAATGGLPPGAFPPGAAADDKPRWTTQRLVVSVATGGRPVEVETIRLVKAESRR